MQHKTSCACGSKKMQVNDGSAEVIASVHVPLMLALLPCGLRNAFQQALLNEFPQYGVFESDELVIEGNLNYEKSFYHSLDEITDTDHLPDIFISSDINNVYHPHFMTQLLRHGFFEEIHSAVAPLFQVAAYNFPASEINCFTTNVLVPVVDLQLLNGRPLPRHWDDLLQNCFERDISLRGDKDFFCNAVFFPFYKTYGKVALTALGLNTRCGLHPAEMVKKMNTGNAGDTCLYVMPYSFALKIRDKERFKVLHPEEGGIVSPVQMLVKKGAYARHKLLIDFILGNKMTEVLNQNGFPTSNPYGVSPLPFKKLWWVGSDFIASHDIAAIKEEMQDLFYKGFVLREKEER